MRLEDVVFSDFCASEFKPPFAVEKLCTVISNDRYDISLHQEHSTIEWLNDLLSLPNLYDKIVGKKAEIRFSKNIIKLFKKIKKYRKKNNSRITNEENSLLTKRLNRLLLEEVYPDETPKIHDTQFAREVFPTELIEIARRRKEVFYPREKKNEGAFVSKDLRNELPEINEVIGAHEELRDMEIKVNREKKSRKNLAKQIYKNFQKSRENLAKEGTKNPLMLIKQMYVNFREKETDHEYKQCKDTYEEKKKKLFEKAKTSTQYELVGLALSGGGIRSATFNLGVIQALAEHDVLKHVDYLSTVSGGGYIGSCLSSVLNDQNTGTEKEQFPLRHQKGITEPEAMKHLRNNGNFIAPNGIIDWLTIPALLLRGAFINLVILFPYVFTAVILTLGIYYSQLQPAYEIKESSLIELESKGVSNDVLKKLKELNTLRLTSEKELSFFLKSRLHNEVEKNVTLKPRILTHIKKVSHWRPFYYVTPRVGIVFLGCSFIFLFIYRRFQSKYKWRTGYEKSFGIALLVVLACAIMETMPAALSYYIALDVDKLKTAIAAVISFVPSVLAGKAAGKVQRWTGQIAIYLLGALGPFIIFIIYAMLSKWMLESCTSWLYPTTILVFAIFVITRVLTDVNITSFHGFYRDRLSKVFLFRINKRKSEVEHNDKQKLNKLNKEGTKAPYHLINVTLNLQSSKDKNVRDRSADFFILSKHFCGSTRTSFCETGDMEKADSHLNLGTAMAISGAAAAPNMGTTTIKPLVFIMALLNIRLGYWIPNPSGVRKDGYSWLKYNNRSPLTGVGPYYLVKELFGCLTENSKYVNISDGNHIENLGIYELLRRKCKYIIACDAEADPDMTFGSLARLIRYARIDLSIDIEIELDDVRKVASGFSHKHCAVGKIYYGNDNDGKPETGHLLYIKSSLTGDENEYIREYRSKHEDFPHESTAHQFFDEAQFEAYRALGYHIADKLDGWEEFRPGGEKRKEDDIVDTWFQKLDDLLLPSYQMEDKFIDMQKQLSDIEKMYLDPDMAEYTYQVYPELKKNTGQMEDKANQDNMVVFGDVWIDKERLRKIFHFCNQQMQLMENVFVALQFDKPYYREHHFNRGWMNLFRRWASAPCFQWSWAISISTYSLGYQMFCEEALMLGKKVTLRPGGKNDLSPDEQDCLRQQNAVSGYNNTERIPSGNETSSYQIWIAEMSVCFKANQQKKTFPIGFAIVHVSLNDHVAELMFYQIRDYYRQMKLLESMIVTLKAKYKQHFKFRVSFQSNEDKSRYGYFFERYGFEV